MNRFAVIRMRRQAELRARKPRARPVGHHLGTCPACAGRLVVVRVGDHLRCRTCNGNLIKIAGPDARVVFRATAPEERRPFEFRAEG